jgi:hypothetical protein
MAFSERSEYKLEILPPHSIIQCRRADIVEKDGNEVGRQYHRTVHVPGSDMSMACSEAQAVAGVLWTADSIAAYEASIPVEETAIPSDEILDVVEE